MQDLNPNFFLIQMINLKKTFYRSSGKKHGSLYLKEYVVKNAELIQNNKYRQNHFQELSQNSEIIPAMSWNYLNTKILQQMSFVNGLKPDLPSNEKKLFNFSRCLDMLRLYEYPHGDICRKNILEDQNQFYLIDIEPILEYPFGNKKTFFASTSYLVHEKDSRDGKISIRTDLLGFGLFLLWVKGYSRDRCRARSKLSKIITEVNIKEIPFQTIYNKLIP